MEIKSVVTYEDHVVENSFSMSSEDITIVAIMIPPIITGVYCIIRLIMKNDYNFKCGNISLEKNQDVLQAKNVDKS